MESDVREDIAASPLVRVLEDWMPPLAPLRLHYCNWRKPFAALRTFIALARDFAAGRLAKR